MKVLPAIAASLALAACSDQPAADTGNAQTKAGVVAPADPVQRTPSDQGNAAARAAGRDEAQARFEPWQSSAILTSAGLSTAQPVKGRRTRVDFGAARADAEAALTRGSGVAAIARGTMDECGAGPIAFTRYAGGLTLLFQDGRFLGWSLREDDGPRWATADGALGIGTARSALGEARVFASTLGEEFTLGGIAGLIDDDRVGDLWAGLSCNFR